MKAASPTLWASRRLAVVRAGKQRREAARSWASSGGFPQALGGFVPWRGRWLEACSELDGLDCQGERDLKSGRIAGLCICISTWGVGSELGALWRRDCVRCITGRSGS